MKTATITRPAHLSCLTMDPKEQQHRFNTAEESAWRHAAELLELPEDTRQVEQVEQLIKKEKFLGSEMLWHTEFPSEFVAMIGMIEISQMGGFLDLEYTDNERKRGQLDRYDFAHLADILREGLAVVDDKLKRLRLKRALAWLKLNAPTHVRKSY